MGSEVYYAWGSDASSRAAAARRKKAEGYRTRWSSRKMVDGNTQYTLHYTGKKKKR